MKKHIIYLLILTTVIACKKDKSAFDKDADDRINEQLKSYQSTITGSPNGWTATLVTRVGLIYSFYFRFNDSNRVFMYCDFDSTTAGVLKESSYRLKSLQQPCLLFDTYSYIHQLADPDASVNGGYPGGGLLSDFEFEIDTIAADTIKLTGRFNGSSAILRKASAQDRAAWENKQVRNNLVALSNLGKILNYFKRLTYNGTEYEIQFNTALKLAVITWMDASGTPHTLATSYFFSGTGLQFSTPVVNGSTTITGFSITGFNTTTNTLQVKVNNNTDATIAGATRPVAPDVQAGRRWWQWGAAAQSYWRSVNGFHVNGIEDAFGVRSLRTDSSSYYYFTYWPGVKPASGPSFDALIPFYYVPAIDDLDFIYGTAPEPSFQSDGRVVFSYLGDLTVGPYPTTGPAFKTKEQFYSTSGYWFVQTSENSYDMVSASDAKAWITWRN
jgi:hypothetical protein